MASIVTGGSGFLARRLADRLRALPGAGPVVLVDRPDDLVDPPTGAGLAVWNCAGLRPVAARDAELLAAVESTGETLAMAEELGADSFHHVSSISVGGRLEGAFAEKHFDEGQDLDSPHSQSAFEQERWVRESATMPWRVYRPGIVLGDSTTGESDAVDGPAHFFSALELSRKLIPEWLPLVGPDFGMTNMVPVDYVVSALVHLSELPGRDGEAFHIGSAEGLNTADVHNLFAAVAHAPRAFALPPQNAFGAMAVQAYRALMAAPALADLRALAFRAVEIPEHVIERMTFTFDFDSSQTTALLTAAGIHCPPLSSYAPLIWEHWRANFAQPT